MSGLGRVLGVDFGTRRIGLALSDREGQLAFPERTLERRGLVKDLAALRTLVAERGVERIVVGLPLHMNGREGPEAVAARQFAAQLAAATRLPVELLDERWTSLEAERALRESGRPGRKQRAVVDAVAASLLLRAYLEKRANESRERPR